MRVSQCRTCDSRAIGTAHLSHSRCTHRKVLRLAFGDTESTSDARSLLGGGEDNRERKGETDGFFSTARRTSISFWSTPTVIRVRHSRRLAFVPLSWYRPDTGDLDSLAEEIYPTFDNRSFARSYVRSLVRSPRRNWLDESIKGR